MKEKMPSLFMVINESILLSLRKIKFSKSVLLNTISYDNEITIAMINLGNKFKNGSKIAKNW